MGENSKIFHCDCHPNCRDELYINLETLKSRQYVKIVSEAYDESFIWLSPSSIRKLINHLRLLLNQIETKESDV